MCSKDKRPFEILKQMTAFHSATLRDHQNQANIFWFAYARDHTQVLIEMNVLLSLCLWFGVPIKVKAKKVNDFGLGKSDIEFVLYCGMKSQEHLLVLRFYHQCREWERVDKCRTVQQAWQEWMRNCRLWKDRKECNFLLLCFPGFQISQREV